MSDEQKRCLACDRDDEQIPLVPLEYRGSRMWICPQHLPVLIHDPAQLADRFPGARGLSPVKPSS